MAIHSETLRTSLDANKADTVRASTDMVGPGKNWKRTENVTRKDNGGKRVSQPNRDIFRSPEKQALFTPYHRYLGMETLKHIKERSGWQGEKGVFLADSAISRLGTKIQTNGLLRDWIMSITILLIDAPPQRLSYLAEPSQDMIHQSNQKLPSCSMEVLGGLAESKLVGILVRH
ncbi:hypothetical protein VTK73DRAFT_6985 [Phialemonium thermophilum]|uniref:Uncharacterized protein n=1 Tax=Phialemonium thermophilum TaxID=223376 RepID=A0ABR3WHC5_9PEZI